MGPLMDAVISKIEGEILPSMVVKDEDLELIREELRGLLRQDHLSLEAETHIAKSRLTHVQSRSQALLDMRLDGGIGSQEYQEKSGRWILSRLSLRVGSTNSKASLARKKMTWRERLPLPIGCLLYGLRQTR